MMLAELAGLLALQSAFARDPLLCASSEVVLTKKAGDPVKREDAVVAQEQTVIGG